MKYTVKNMAKHTQEDQFLHQLAVLWEDLTTLFKSKTGEYGGTKDMFRIIKAIAALKRVSPPQECINACTKHFVSLLYDIDTLTNDERREKVNDIHLYMEYAMALVNEEK